MPTPNFPEYAIPAFSGYDVTRASAVDPSTFEMGWAQRRRRGRVLVARRVTFHFHTGAQYLAFREWFTTTIHRGASWFNWREPLTGQILLTRIVGGMPDQEPEQTLRHWYVALTLESWDA